MGGRLSLPRLEARLSEHPHKGYYLHNLRNLRMPLTALATIGIFYWYSLTSARAAKLNAKKTREADGGHFNWHNETMRKRGQMEKPKDMDLLKEALLSEVEGSKTPKKASALGHAEETRRAAREQEWRRMVGKEEGRPEKGQ